MKIDKIQVRLIIGLIFVAIISIIIFFLEPKEKNKINEKNIYRYK